MPVSREEARASIPSSQDAQTGLSSPALEHDRRASAILFYTRIPDT